MPEHYTSELFTPTFSTPTYCIPELFIPIPFIPISFISEYYINVVGVGAFLDFPRDVVLKHLSLFTKVSQFLFLDSPE